MREEGNIFWGFKKEIQMKQFRKIWVMQLLMSLAWLMPLSATVTWQGSSVSNVTASVDPNLVISSSLGNVILPTSYTTIYADTGDVNVTLNGSPTVVGNAGGASQLYLKTNPGHAINFNIVSNSLTFHGSANVPTLTPLLIIISGGGTVNFIFDTINFVNLNGNVGSFGGVQMYLYMGDPAANNAPTLKLSTSATVVDNYPGLWLQSQSILGYISGNKISDNGGDNDQAYIVFDGTNTSPAFTLYSNGGLLCEVDDTSMVTISGVYVNSDASFPDLNDIDRTIPAGKQAVFRTICNTNNGPHALVNLWSDNNTLPTLLSNPFLQTAPFDGNRYGFVLGANGLLDIQDNVTCYFVGDRDNVCPNIVSVPGISGTPTGLIKPRNPSAFFVDGNPDANSVPAQINVGTNAGLFFGNLYNGTSNNTVAPNLLASGDGEIVFDVEGTLNITGSGTSVSKMEIWSLQMQSTGGELFPGDGLTTFPARTFATASYQPNPCAAAVDYLASYNKGCFLVNTNQMNLTNLTLSHTDTLHKIVPKNDALSEPTYVGGETWNLLKLTSDCNYQNLTAPRPAMNFYNANFNINTDVALTGVDTVVHPPISPATTNTSNLNLFYNGYSIDHGTSRNVIFGTSIGSTGCGTGTTTINADAHLNLLPTGNVSGTSQNLFINTLPNDGSVTQGLPVGSTTAIQGQYGQNDIYLGHNSNISIGTQISTSSCPAITCSTSSSQPTLTIAGDFLAFSSRGGDVSAPLFSGISGTGGIFIDECGTFTIQPQYIAAMEAMVVQGCSSTVNLPKNQVRFKEGFGITYWQPDMTASTVVIPAGTTMANYTLNWVETKKNYSVFTPYALTSGNVCFPPLVVPANMTGIPTIQGEVQQFQLAGARNGDVPHVLVDGGIIREFSFTRSDYTGDSPVAVLVVKNNALVGINTNKINTQSPSSETKFGVNGITVIADGNATIAINDTMLIDNRCAFVGGPDFGATNTLTLTSDAPRELRVTKTGVLNLQLNGGKLKLAGQLQVVLEPGARIVWQNGSILECTDNVVLTAEPYLQAQTFFNSLYANAGTGYGANVANTDPFRVKFVGSGSLLLSGQAAFYINKDSFVGVETYQAPQGALDYPCVVNATLFEIQLVDQALFSIGKKSSLIPGGSFQVGNTANLSGHTVAFTLLVNGADAQVEMREQSFLGLNVGIVNRGAASSLSSSQPNNWLVDVLYNVTNTVLQVAVGTFYDANIFPGNSPSASLLAVGREVATSPNFQLLYPASKTLAQQRASRVTIYGGGNLALITRGAHPLNPTVLTQDGLINANLSVGMLAGTPILPTASPAAANATTFFGLVKSPEAVNAQVTPNALNLANASIETEDASSTANSLTVGYVDRGTLARAQVYNVQDSRGGTQEDVMQRASKRGGVSFAFQVPLPTAPAAPASISQLV